MTDLLTPVPGFISAPFANAVDDGPTGGKERVPHGEIRLFGVELAGVAPVVFQVVDAPFGIGEGILKLVPPAARLAGAVFQPASE